MITLVFSLLACKKSKDFLFQASHSAVMGGLFVSAIKLIVLMSQLEKIADGSAGFSGSISFQSFLIMLFVRFRPLLIGAAFIIIFRIIMVILFFFFFFYFILFFFVYFIHLFIIV